MGNNELAKKEERLIKFTADFGEVYCRERNGEIMRPTKADMTLYEKARHFYKIAGKWAISHQGYKQLNKVAAISILNPKSVMVDGVERHNPHVERNPRTKLIESIFVRKIGIGDSPMGNTVVVDKTLYYNLKTYFIQSVIAKMNKLKWKKNFKTDPDVLEFPGCAELGEEKDRPKADGKWVWYEVEDPMGVWVNYAHPAIMACFEEHIQRQKFGDRMAQSIVERNIMKDHPSIGVAEIPVVHGTTDGEHHGTVTVYGYRHDRNARSMTEILEHAENGDSEIEVHAESIVDVSEDENREAYEEAAVTEDAKEKKTKPETKPDAPEKGDKDLKNEFHIQMEKEGQLK